MKINVILPCLNEEQSIGQTIEAILKLDLDLKILVVDNGISDRTIEVASRYGVKILHAPKKGKGFAFRRGIDNLDHDCKYVFMVDGDDTYEVEPLRNALNSIDFGYDMVIGNRVALQHHAVQRKNLYRPGHKFGNKILSYIYKRLFGIHLSDTLSGWRLMSRSFTNSFGGGASGFEIEAELNVHAFTLSASILEIPIEYRGRYLDSESKLNTITDGWAIMRRNLALYKSERPSIAYGFLSTPWLVISGYLGIKVGQTYLETQLVPQFPSLIVGIATFIIAGNLWVTGMILERVRLNRVQLARIIYRGSIN